MARRLGLAAMVGAALVLAGCGDSGPDLKSEFAARLSEDWQVESFKVEAKEDVGNKVEPQFSYRYRAEVSPRADLYQRVGALEGTDILERVMKKGEEAPALGTARALFRADKWETVFSPEQAPDFRAGRPASAFADKQVVLGSSEYRRLLENAKTALSKRAAQIQADQAEQQKQMAEWNALAEEGREADRQRNEKLRQEQQRIQQEQMKLRTQTRAQIQELDKTTQEALQAQAAEPKRALDAQLAELDKTYRLQVAELRAQRTEHQQAQGAQRRQLRDANNADLAQARKRLDSADFIRYRAAAEEKMRAGTAALEAEFNGRYEQLRERENALSNERRDQAAKLNAAYQAQIESARGPLAEKRDGHRNEINQQAKEAMDKLDAELRELRQQQQDEARKQREQLNAKRRDIDRQSASIQESRRQGMQAQRLIEQLEQRQG